MLNYKILFITVLSTLPTLAWSDEPQEILLKKLGEPKLATHVFTKDAPILGFKITSEKFGDLPAEIKAVIGNVDEASYSAKYLKGNVGSVVALQWDGKNGKPDFYPIGKGDFDTKYVPAAVDEVKSKSGKYFGNVSSHLGNMTSDSRFVAVRKTAPVTMYKMSELGYPMDKEIKIKAPASWGDPNGTQKKPAGQDGYLTINEQGEVYMVNVDEKGKPLHYVDYQPKAELKSIHARVPAAAGAEVRGEKSVKVAGEKPKAKWGKRVIGAGIIGVGIVAGSQALNVHSKEDDAVTPAAAEVDEQTNEVNSSATLEP